MVSNIRYFSFKELDLAKRKPFSIFIFIILSMIVIIMQPVIVLFIFALAYVFSGPVMMIRAWRKRRVLRKLEPVPDEDLVVRG
jgi:CDP-diacylglycerol--serine O-phosphatidyltransferase